MIGEECDLLGIASPYTYIVNQRTLVFVTKVDKFYKEMLNLNPLGLEEIKTAAALKLKEMNSMAREKKQWDSTVDNIKSIRQAQDIAVASENRVRKQYPTGDKPVVTNIMKIIQNKAAMGES